VIALKQCRLVTAVIGGCLAATLLGASLTASAQDQSAATAKDVIFARKTMMDTLSDNMDQIEAMIASNKIDLADAHEHADTVSVMLMAFPHLFPPSSNQWKPNVDRDPGSDTYAAPEIWTRFADFYKRAKDTAEIAYKASRAETEQAFKEQVAQLRVACDSCHGSYMKRD